MTKYHKQVGSSTRTPTVAIKDAMPSNAGFQVQGGSWTTTEAFLLAVV